MARPFSILNNDQHNGESMKKRKEIRIPTDQPFSKKRIYTPSHEEIEARERRKLGDQEYMAYLQRKFKRYRQE